MKSIVVLLFLGMVPRSALAISCIVEMGQITSAPNKVTQDYINLLRSLSDKNFVSVLNLNQLAHSSVPVNPFNIAAIKVSTEQKFVYERAFNTVLGKQVREALNWTEVQTHLKLMIDEKKTSQGDREKAHKDTASLIFIQKTYQFPKSYRGNHTSPFSLGYAIGHPLIVGRFAHDGVLSDQLIDPVRKTISTLEGQIHLEKPPSSSFPQLFNFAGQDYIYRPDYYRIVYDLGTLQNVGWKFYGLDVEGGQSHGPKRADVFQDKEGVKVVGVFIQDGGRSPGILEKNITDPSKKPRVLAQWPGTNDPHFDTVEGHPFLSFISTENKTLQVFDLENKINYPPVRIERLLEKNPFVNYYATVFRANGMTQAMVPVVGGFVFIDVERGIQAYEIIERSSSHTEIHITQINGEPHAYFRVSEGVGNAGIVLLNLVTLTHWFVGAPFITSEATEFSIRENRYLVWGTGRGEIEIYNPVTHQVTSSKPLFRENIWQVVPYYFEGHVFALVSQLVDPPGLVQLTGPLP